MIRITSNFYLDEKDIHFQFVASPGPGGQNVNKLATAAQLRVNIMSLPEGVRTRITSLYAITNQGDIIIKASRFRTQERNKQDALNRLISLLKQASIIPKKRRKTKPTKASVEKRLQHKKVHGAKKSSRRAKLHE